MTTPTSGSCSRRSRSPNTFGRRTVALEDEIRRVAGQLMFIPPFNEGTSEIASNLGKSYARGRPLSAVAREIGADRVALKADLLIVATALQHSARHLLTGDPGCYAVAKFAGLEAKQLQDLP